jgi:hypothetical protein
MRQHNESLEIGIAAGLDVPTAMVLSGRTDDQPPEGPTAKSHRRTVFAAVALVFAAMILWHLTRHLLFRFAL